MFLEPKDIRKNWVAYFDLLGFTNLVKNNTWIRTLIIYEELLDEIKTSGWEKGSIERVWFSDTILFFTDLKSDDSQEEIEGLLELDHIVRWFIYRLIKKEIVVRGALSYGEFYSDINQNAFIGNALIEAYRYGEAQDWIGFIMCPSAAQRSEELGLQNDRMNVVGKYKVPFKERSSSFLEQSLPVYRFGNSSEQMNECLRFLEIMMAGAPLETRHKYEKAIAFQKKHILR